jgi:mRNA interferase MazF
VRRGEVWWADLPAPIGRRPVLLLSRDRAYAVRNAITVAFVTTTIRNIPVEVKLTPADGMPKECVVNPDVVNTVPKSALANRICTLTPAKLAAVARAARFALDRRGLERPAEKSFVCWH